MSRVGEKIKNIRNSIGMTQKQLGKKLGVNESFVNEVENGRKIINQNLIDRISKVLGKDINDITMSFEEQVFEEEKDKKYSAAPKKEAVKDVWNEAFGSVLKNIPIYGYDLQKAVSFKQLPLINNKVEGHSQDKVFYLQIEDDDMLGFRIAKGDLAFAYSTHEIENNSICLIEHGSKRVIRQIKRLDNNKVLLISNKGSFRTETAEIKEINIIAKLNRVEIKL
ncbi:DNA-binding protein [Clostridium carboxidivorans P7]|uniref:Transcriptional regulator, XRE family n=1 Tax=Clostridium carboxidivorans P7 TaxID=536227 RepID=C6PQA7_9CLOT|nr:MULTISPECIES: XRE family transcriptional regulator [Clostridium]AKN33060.1 DNA-binding protein [Clostridium carboxidivorans P7]EET88577.1 transcriptional regulator, XRE family [Clostridium carboxidivorans P7]EFG88017.1 helix-turn-helix domain-containing protein [Clostridium carboxidivorans P7]WPC41846.1 XRE family transcriptional regulator [Clostridium sp. JS66]